MAVTALIRGRQAFLAGSVPDEASRAALVALLSEVIGPGPIVDNLWIHPTADVTPGDARFESAAKFTAGPSATLHFTSFPVFDQVLRLLDLRPDATLTIESHVAGAGDEEANVDLAQRRADAVLAWFTERAVDVARITVDVRGSEDTRVDDAAADAVIGRVEITVRNALGVPG